MKNLIMWALLVALMLSLVACGSGGGNDEASEPATEGTEPIVETTVKVEETTEASETEAERSDLLPYTFKVPRKNIYIDVPNYQEIELGYTKIYILHDIKFVSITMDKRDEVSATTLEEAHNCSTELLLMNIQDNCLLNSVEIDESEIVTVRGVEVMRYTGRAIVATDYFDRTKTRECYTAGFSFIMDGIPCNVATVVMDPTQDADMIEEMTTIIDEMLASLRSEA